MSTNELRKAMKKLNPEIRVSAVPGGATNLWTVRTKHDLDEVRALLAELGLREVNLEVEGGRFDWTYCLSVR